jgi:hypothetical protein
MRFTRMTFALMILLGLSAASSAHAQPAWRQVYTDTRVRVALDTIRVSRDGAGDYTMILRWDYATPRLLEDRRQYRRMVQQVRVRCTPAPIRVERFGAAVYSASGVLIQEARPLTASELRYMDWDRLRPGTEGARVFPAVCRTVTTRPRRPSA